MMSPPLEADQVFITVSCLQCKAEPFTPKIKAHCPENTLECEFSDCPSYCQYFAQFNCHKHLYDSQRNSFGEHLAVILTLMDLKQENKTS